MMYLGRSVGVAAAQGRDRNGMKWGSPIGGDFANYSLRYCPCDQAASDVVATAAAASHGRRSGTDPMVRP